MEEIQAITWNKLKEFVNSIPEELLDKKASLLLEDETFSRDLNEPFFIEHDVYCHKEDGEYSASEKELKEMHKDEEDFTMDDYILVTKKGTPFLYIS